MGNLVDTRAVGPPSHIHIKSVAKDSGTPGVAAGQAGHADRSEDAAQAALQHGPYRKVHADLCCIRLIAASAIVAGLLLGTAPAALAQVGHLIATTPAAFVQELPRQGTSTAGAVDADRPSAQSGDVERTVQHRADTHSVASMFSWNGTSRALRCSYGLLFDGNTRSCQAA
jgi:hypothetical protein